MKYSVNSKLNSDFMICTDNVVLRYKESSVRLRHSPQIQQKASEKSEVIVYVYYLRKFCFYNEWGEH